MMILFSHVNDSSCLFSLLPRELVMITLSGVHIFSKDSKLTLNYKKKQSVSPCAIKFVPRSNQLYVADMYNIVSYSNGSKSSMFRLEGLGQHTKPTGMALSNNSQKLYISDSFQIQQFNLERHSFSRFRILTNDEMFRPNHMSVSKYEHLFITDLKHRIQVLDENGQFLYKFGQQGSQPSQFGWTQGIAVSKHSNKLFVSDSSNHRIQAFKQNGDFLFSFGRAGNEKDLFLSPRGICLDEEDNIFIADIDHNLIKSFDANGNFLFCFGGSDYMEGPIDVDVDGEGRVYVCNHGTSDIQKWN